MSRLGSGAPALATFGFALTFSLAFQDPALAHAELRASEPADGVVLRTSPDLVALTFTEPMQVTSLRLVDEAGRERPLRRQGERAAHISELRASIVDLLPPGSYRIEYRGLSADGHVARGAVRFWVETGAR